MDNDDSGEYDENDSDGDDDDEMTTRTMGMGTVGQRRESVPGWDKVDCDVLWDGVNNMLVDREVLCHGGQECGAQKEVGLCVWLGFGYATRLVCF